MKLWRQAAAAVVLHTFSACASPEILRPSSLTDIDSRSFDSNPGDYSKLRSGGSVTLPLERRRERRLWKRDSDTASIGLGDAEDVTYNVLVQFGDTQTPLVLDTGSSDLWVLSDSCKHCFGLFSATTAKNLPPFYSTSTFKSTGMNATLAYGDSSTGTLASGEVGSDVVGVAGLFLPNQYFAAINYTNTTVISTGSAGIFGLGYPVNSMLWNQLYSSQISSPASHLMKRSDAPLSTSQRLLPPLDNLSDDPKSKSSASTGLSLLSSFSVYGPLVPRLVLAASDALTQSTPSLASPQFSITLQRTTPASDGNKGLLTLGALPAGVSNSSLTWVPVRLYTPEQNGLNITEAPGENYPFAWEVFLEDVWFDGVKLPRSTLGDSSKVRLSALVDTGNSLIRGPSDVIAHILSKLSNTTTSSSSSNVSSTDSAPSTITYPCSHAHRLSFQFGGKRFDVDPRDFGAQALANDVDECVPNLAATDPPVVGGYLYSWSLGDPFLRSVLSSFYYGNITHPSRDPPRIGFRSTVPADASAKLQQDIKSAKAHSSNFPLTTISAPTGTFHRVHKATAIVNAADPYNTDTSPSPASTPSIPTTLSLSPSSNTNSNTVDDANANSGSLDDGGTGESASAVSNGAAQDGLSGAALAGLRAGVILLCVLVCVALLFVPWV